VSTRLVGATPLAVRLPSALAAALTALALWQWARRRVSERAGLLAAAVYVLCPLTVGLARLAMTDSLLTLWLTLTFIGLIEGYRNDRRGYMLAAAGAALATLTKGAIGFLLPGAVMCLWLLLRRDFRELRRVPWLGALSLFLLLTLPWHLTMWWVHGAAFIQEYFVRRHLQRFLGQGYKYNFPIWYYLPVLMLGAFPFSVLVPGAWWESFRQWRSQREELKCATAMWALASVVILAVFSISKSKLPQYALPALPALALLLAVRLDASWQRGRGLSVFEAACLGLTGVVLGELLVAAGVLGWQWTTEPVPALEAGLSIFHFATKKAEFLVMLAPQLVILGSALLIGTAITLSFRKTASRAASVMILMSMTTAVVIGHYARSAWSDYYHSAPLNQLAQQALPALQHGEQLILYDLGSPTRYSLRFLLGHIDQITDTSEAEVLLRSAQEHRHGYIITPRGIQPSQAIGNLQREAKGWKWVLWRFDIDRAGDSSVVENRY
jgi:4-amino-4-deoxy-L-arabinose transferase-like glycosyltransferase